MTNKIKELAGQAGYTPLPGFGFANDIQELFIKKFAELIVKECIEINKQELAFNAFERLMNKYKEHFGVEE